MTLTPLASRNATSPARRSRPASSRAAAPTATAASAQRPMPRTPQPVAPAAAEGRIARTFEALGWVARAIATGREAVLGGRTVPYTKLDAAERQAAAARGAGRAIPQESVSLDAAGTIDHELYTLVLEGTQADVQQALETSGWTQANTRSPWSFIKVGLSVLTNLFNDEAAPVTQLFLHGQGEVMAFNKNSDFGRTRDHLRVFQLGPNRWAIAASRDTALAVTVHRPTFVGPLPWSWQFKAPSIGHQIDHDLDRERDMVMADLLKSGLTKTWSVLDGQRPAGVSQRPLPDGRLEVEGFGSQGLVTDGQVYEVKLGR